MYAIRAHMDLAYKVTKEWKNPNAANFLEYIHSRLLYAQGTPHMNLFQRFGMEKVKKMLEPELVLHLDSES